jgi:hypothetical protein
MAKEWGAFFGPYTELKLFFILSSGNIFFNFFDFLRIIMAFAKTRKREYICEIP